MNIRVNSRTEKIKLGIALVIFGSILVFGKPSQPTPVNTDYTFKEEPVRVEGFPETSEGERPTKIIIPALSIDLEVKPARIVSGYWEVFSDSAGWGEGSGLPGEKGNQVIFAHAREGLFFPLKNIKEKDKIYMMTNKNWFLYEVGKIKEVYPNQIEVIAPTEDETLTLYTCSGFNDEKRLIVTAKRKESER